MDDKTIAIMVGYKDRPTELSLLLQSLRTQTNKNFHVFVSDDCSGTPIQAYHFLTCILNKMNDEGNFVYYTRNDFNLGVSKNRQKLIENVKKAGDYKLVCRIDDDCILEPDYIEQLMEVINQGYDLASGVVPFIGQPQFKREARFITPIGNKVILDNKGELLVNMDDFGMQYFDKQILPIHHFRSCALYKMEMHDKVDYNSRLTKHGFREEQILSFKMILNGYKLGVNTHAVAWHLLTPSGGERFAESGEMVKLNEQVMKEWVKEMYEKHEDFISKYNEKLGIKIEYKMEDSYHPANLIKI